MIIIASELADLPHVPISTLRPLQGELKQLSEREYNKLKKSIIENGLFVPFFVWKEGGQLLDGHQRLTVFEREGWHVDVPVIWISADSEEEAKKKLLLISSQYGKVTPEGWQDFTVDLDIDWVKDSVQFDALPVFFSTYLPTSPANDPWEEWEGMPEFNQQAVAYKSIRVHFPDEISVVEFSKLIQQPISEKTSFIWYPPQPNITKKLFRVVDEP